MRRNVSARDADAGDTVVALESYMPFIAHLVRLASVACAVYFLELSLASAAEVTDNPNVKILYLEPVAPLSIPTADTSRKLARSNPAPEISFDAFGKRFALTLARNVDLLVDLPAREPSSLTLYRGELRGIAGSWVRLGIQGEELRGMMWDGNELYVVESVERVRAAAVEAANVPASGPVIFRLSDTEVKLGPEYCGAASEPPEETGLQLYKSIASEIRLARKPTLSSRLEVSVVGDALYLARYSNASEAQDEALVRLNNVDGIFSDQLGVNIHVQSVRIEDSTTNSFSSTTDAASLLGELSRVREHSSSLSSAGLTHLLTGRDLDGQTVGIAYISAVCSTRYGAGLAEIRGRGAWTESLISAHEMGHSFGAVHDGEGECSATPATFLMAPRVNGSSTFSQCSLSHIQPIIQSASCLAPISNADVTNTNANSTTATTPPSTTNSGGGGGTTDLAWLAALLGLLAMRRLAPLNSGPLPLVTPTVNHPRVNHPVPDLQRFHERYGLQGLLQGHGGRARRERG